MKNKHLSPSSAVFSTYRPGLNCIDNFIDRLVEVKETVLPEKDVILHVIFEWKSF